MRASLSKSRVAALVAVALAFGCQKSGSGLSPGNGANPAGTGTDQGTAAGTDQGTAAGTDQGTGAQVAIPPAGGGTGAGTAAPPAPEAKDIDSKDILARSNPADEAFTKQLVIAWKDLAEAYGGQLNDKAKNRTNADAAALATDLAAKLGKAAPDQVDALIKDNWEMPGPVHTDALDITSDAPVPPPLKNLALRLKVGEVGIVKLDLGYLIVLRVAAPALDPLESADILARPAGTEKVFVQHVLIGYKEAPAVAQGMGSPEAKARSKADADKLAKDIATQAKGGADFKALMKKYSEDPGSKDSGEPYPVDAQAQLVPTFKKLAMRLKDGEVGMVLSPYGWHVMKRVPPPPPPPADSLESTDILKRDPQTKSTSVKHILLGWTEVHANDPRGEKRTRADLEKLVKDLVAQLKGGAKIEALMTQYSEDPGSAQSGESYPVTPDAGLVEPFKNLSLRLKVGEVGVVKTQFGIHIIQRCSGDDPKKPCV
jgi:hypothetical protein